MAVEVPARVGKGIIKAIKPSGVGVAVPPPSVYSFLFIYLFIYSYPHFCSPTKSKPQNPTRKLLIFNFKQPKHQHHKKPIFITKIVQNSNIYIYI
jgi:hypothetical protein